MPSTEQVKQALDERVAIGDLSHLVTPEINNPVQYIGLVATALSEGLKVAEGEA